MMPRNKQTKIRNRTQIVADLTAGLAAATDPRPAILLSDLRACVGRDKVREYVAGDYDHQANCRSCGQLDKSLSDDEMQSLSTRACTGCEAVGFVAWLDAEFEDKSIIDVRGRLGQRHRLVYVDRDKLLAFLQSPSGAQPPRDKKAEPEKKAA